ncbi:MAG: PAS domain-containing protein, partial [Desulfobulbaceae bacterium]|nr:PAS domain-containing protein [Desulfobulbaceae bacterium]
MTFTGTKPYAPMSDRMPKRSSDKVKPASGPVFELFQTFPEPVYTIDPEGIVLDANIRLAEQFGRTLRECIGASIYELIDACGIYPEGSGARRKAQIEEVLHAGSPMTFEDELNGMASISEIYPIHAENGSITKLFVISRQIAEEKCEQLTCAETLARTNAALENVSAAIWNLHLQSGNVVRSPGHDKLFGYDSDIPDWTNDHFITQIIDEDRPRCVEVMKRARASSSKTPWQLEFRIRKPDGS